MEESGANFVSLVQILMKDPAERSIFFKVHYPSICKRFVLFTKLLYCFLNAHFGQNVC